MTIGFRANFDVDGAGETPNDENLLNYLLNYLLN